MAHVFDVARYILERQGPVTTLKLQKLVYYVQAWASAKGEPLISDTVKAWVQGPVVPSLYQQHKGLRQISAADMTAHGRGLTDQDRAHIDSVLAYYGAMPPSYLKKLTHFERPWKDARAEGERLGHASPAIPVAALRAFYRGRTPEELEADFQMTVAREVMDQHKQCLARLAL
ncbi:MAG TPA: type II toxin-antitoxin system antitoxin SocA domain-containing protein [Kofleriaceae bacterium]|nr:type II toxin-antitoxin system antitoxin SocA domain-containing protein [Kofleriaceae bacterium]